MNTLLKSLLVAFCFSTISFSASKAETNPNHPKVIASYKTGIYTTLDGKLSIALDKETTGAVDVRLKNLTGKVLFFQRIAKNEMASRLRLDLSEMVDGVYQVEISNGVETTTHAVTLSTRQPTSPSRLVAVN